MIGILSDTHDNLPMIERAVRLFNDAGCDLVIHAGDIVAPFAARALAGLRAPVKAVFGNCDGEIEGLVEALVSLGEIRKPPFLFEHGGLRFLLVHSSAGLAAFLAADAPDIVVSGHTHRPEVRRKGKTLIVNPGEACGWVNGRATVCLFDPTALTADILPL
ncbi:MAG: metallophosphoesterase [Candidatus Aminicenantes bacterium]|nr:metallophosphoesterase [Candidatus Aminicenantes bacterium]